MNSPRAFEKAIRETISRGRREDGKAATSLREERVRSIREVIIEHEIFGKVVRLIRRNIVSGCHSRILFRSSTHSLPDEVMGTLHGMEDLKSDFATVEAIRARLKP